MQTVEQNNITVADDGQSLPTERGSAGENTNQGSDAESQDAAAREWEELISSERYGALYRAHVSEIIKKRLGEEKHSGALLQNTAALLGLTDPRELPARIAQLLAPASRDWASEERAVQDKYPEFDLQKHAQDPAFATLLQGFAGHPEVSLTKVYELTSWITSTPPLRRVQQQMPPDRSWGRCKFAMQDREKTACVILRPHPGAPPD